MAEAASQLDLDQLIDKESSQLVPKYKKQPLYERKSSLYLFIVLGIGIISVLIRWIIQSFQDMYYPLLIVLLLLFYFRKEMVKDIFQINDKGISVPYLWFYRRTIPWENIIRVSEDLISHEQEDQIYAIRVFLDTTLIKYNITGMQDPNIVLSVAKYEKEDLEWFADIIMEQKRKSSSTPNTQAQRLKDQVDRAWRGRWKLIFLNAVDVSTESLIYILVIEALFVGFLDYSVWPYLGTIMVGLIALFVFVIHTINKPQAIIGFRPHELGPLIYDEEEIITTVRFVVMCRPYTVHLQHCEVVHGQGATPQVNKMKQIQPVYVESGEITHAVAQILGNHSKATGAKIQFSYKEKDDKLVYEVPIKWA